MKKIVLVLASILMANICLFAQQSLEPDELSSHGLVLVGRFGASDDLTFKDRSVRVLELKERQDLAIGYTNDMGGNINLKYLRIEGPDWAAFEEKMAIVNEKFAKWTQTAKTDGVTNFKKTIPVDFENIVGKWSIGFTDGYWETKLYAVFEVDSAGGCTLRLDDWEEYDSRSSSYESQMHSPFFVFESPESFNVLYELIKVENVKKNYDQIKAKINAKLQAENDRDAKFD